MADACYRHPEGRAPQSRTASASGSRSTVRCCRVAGAGVLHLVASSLPLPRTSSATEEVGSSGRSQTSICSQTSTELDSAGPGVRYNEAIVHQRGGQPGVARAAIARARAWVSRNQVGHGPVGWSIGLIVCCWTNLYKPTSCWCRTNGGQSVELEKELRNRQNLSRR
jgi:hypothetical protein